MSSFSYVISGGTPNTANQKYWNGEINWFTPTEIGNEKYVSESHRKITSLGLFNSSAKLIKANSILLTSRATIGAISINQKDCTTNQGFQSLTPNDVDLNYLYYLISTKHFQNKLVIHSSKSTFLEISHKEISKLKINVPVDEHEQEKIGLFFSLIDNKIKIITRKINILKKYKKGLQEFVFKKSTKPFIKLNLLVTFMPKSKISARNSIQNGLYPFYLSGEKIGTINSFMYKGCYIIANDGGEAGFRLSNGPFAYSDHCICFCAKKDHLTRNIYEFLDLQKREITYVGFLGSGLKNIDRNYLQNLKIPQVVKNENLSSLFLLINKKINYYQNKLAKLKATKEYLLFNMFI